MEFLKLKCQKAECAFSFYRVLGGQCMAPLRVALMAALAANFYVHYFLFFFSLKFYILLMQLAFTPTLNAAVARSLF